MLPLLPRAGIVTIRFGGIWTQPKPISKVRTAVIDFLLCTTVPSVRVSQDYCSLQGYLRSWLTRPLHSLSLFIGAKLLAHVGAKGGIHKD